ncbi:MAG: UDP-N-acetylmuramoyl-tripeptide--D-alanyl-D-alanine ligase [Syntrophotaleaceae bacterium]
MKIDVQTIARITGGTVTPSKAQATVSGVSTDSRKIRDGELFVPLHGPNFDGHDFLLQAVRNGAAACLSEDVIAGFPVPVVRVADTLKAMGDLAASQRALLRGPLVAVTGSSGKTTTKEMLGSILRQGGPGLITEGNFNNLIGLPLTLFRLTDAHRWAVLEMGMSARGEIARLTEIASPDIGVITNIGPAHLETLLSLDGIARAKGELFAGLSQGGTAVINMDDERVAGLPVANGVRRILFGCAPPADVRAEKISLWPGGVEFQLCLPEGRWPVRLHIHGRFNVHNALAAAAAAYVIGVKPAEIGSGLERFRPYAGRMETTLLGEKVVLLEDCYNANPLAVKAALVTLDDLAGDGRRVAVLGDMLELGEAAGELHREVGREVARRADLLILLGEFARHTAEGARQGGLAADRIIQVDSHEKAVESLEKLIRPGDRVLVKGSRGMKMERICAALKTDHAREAVGH